MIYWRRFYDEIYPKYIAANLGYCAGGNDCGVKGAGGWACCKADISGDGRKYVALPYEEEWQREYVRENESEQNESDLPRGCDGCSYRKSLLCALWPVVPVVSIDGDWMVGLQLWCEAFMIVPKSYIPHVEFASEMARTIAQDYPSITADFMMACSHLNDSPQDIELRLTKDKAVKLLNNPKFPTIVRTIMDVGLPEGLSEDVLRLPVLK